MRGVGKIFPDASERQATVPFQGSFLLAVSSVAVRLPLADVVTGGTSLLFYHVFVTRRVGQLWNTGRPARISFSCSARMHRLSSAL